MSAREKRSKIALNNSFASGGHTRLLAIGLSVAARSIAACARRAADTKRRGLHETPLLQDDGVLQEAAPELEPEVRGRAGLALPLCIGSLVGLRRGREWRIPADARLRGESDPCACEDGHGGEIIAERRVGRVEMTTRRSEFSAAASSC